MTSLPHTSSVTKNRSGSNTRQVLQRNVALYPDDIERVEAIRQELDYDSFSKAVRKAIELATEYIADTKDAA